jgi:hypothetical protein
MDKDYLQLALAKFNIGKHQWYGWKKDWTGEKRMSYENIILNDNTATMPTETEVNAKIQELKDAETQKENDKTSATNKLKALGLTDAEIEAL